MGQNEKYQLQRPQTGDDEAIRSIIKEYIKSNKTNMILLKNFLKKIISLKVYQREAFEQCFAELAENSMCRVCNFISECNVILSLLSLAEPHNYKNIAKCFLYLLTNTKLFVNFKHYYFDIYIIQKLSKCNTIGKFLKWSLRIRGNSKYIITNTSYYWVIFVLIKKITVFLGCKHVVETKDPTHQDSNNLLFVVIKGKLIRVQYQQYLLESENSNEEINDRKLFDFLSTLPPFSQHQNLEISFEKFDPNKSSIDITEDTDTVIGLSMFCNLPPPTPVFSDISQKIYEISRYELLVNCDQIGKWYTFVDYLYKDMEKYQTKNLSELISKTEDKMALEKYLTMDFSIMSEISTDFIQFQEKIKQILSEIPNYNYRKCIAIINEKQNNYSIIEHFRDTGLINENVDDKLLKQFTEVRDQFIDYHPQVDIKRLYKFDENDNGSLSGINWIEPIVKYSFVCRLISDLKDYPVIAFDQLISIDKNYLEFAEEILLKGDPTKIGDLEDYATFKVYMEYSEKPELLVDKLWLGNFDKLKSNFKTIPDSWFKYAYYLMNNYAMDSDLIFPPKNVNFFHKIAQKGFAALQSIENFEKIDLSKVYNFKQYFEIISPLVKDKESSSFKLFKLVCETIETNVKMDEPLPDVLSYLHKQRSFYPIGEWLRNQYLDYDNIISTHIYFNKITLAVVLLRIISNPKILSIPISKKHLFDALFPICKEFDETIHKLKFSCELNYFVLMSLFEIEPNTDDQLSRFISTAFIFLVKQLQDVPTTLDFFNFISIVYMYINEFNTTNLSKIATRIQNEKDIEKLIKFNFSIFKGETKLRNFFTQFQSDLKKKDEEIKKQKKRCLSGLKLIFQSSEWDKAVAWFNEIQNNQIPYLFIETLLHYSVSSFNTPLNEQLPDFCPQFVQYIPNEYNYLFALAKYSYHCYVIEKAKNMHLYAFYCIFKDRVDSTYTKEEVANFMVAVYNKDYTILNEILNEYKLYYYTQIKDQPDLLFRQNVVKKLNEFGNEFNNMHSSVYEVIGKIWKSVPIQVVLKIPEDIDIYIQNAKLSPEKVSKLLNVDINKYKPKQQENIEIERPDEYKYFKNPIDYNRYALSHLFLQRLKEQIRNIFYKVLSTEHLSVAHIIIRAFSTVNVLNNSSLKKSITTKFMDIINSRISSASDDYQREFLSIFIYLLYDHKPPKPPAIQSEFLKLTELAIKKDEAFLDRWINYMTKFYDFIIIAKSKSFDAIAKEVKEWSDYEMFMNFDFKKEFDGYDCNTMIQFQNTLKSDMTTRPSYYLSLFESIISSKKNNYEIIKFFIDNDYVNINQSSPHVLKKLINLSEIQNVKTQNNYKEEFKKVKLNEINNADFDIGWLKPLVKFSHDLSLIEKCRNYDFFAIYEMVNTYPESSKYISDFLSKEKFQVLDELEKQTYDELYKAFEEYPDLFNPKNLLTKLNMTAMTYKSLKSESISQLFDLISSYDLNEEIVIPKQNFLRFFDHCTKLFPFLSNVSGFWKYKPPKFTTFSGFAKDVKKMIGKKPLPEFDQLRKFCDQIETFNDEKIIYFDDIKELKNREYKNVPLHYLLMKKYPSLSYFYESINMEKITLGLIVFRLLSSMNIFDTLQESETLNGQISEVNSFDAVYISNLNEKDKINMIEYYIENCKDLFIQILKENNFQNNQINQIIVNKNIDNIIKTALEAREIFSKMHLQHQKTISNSNKYFLMNYSDYKNINLINSSLSQIKNWSEKENYDKYIPRYFSEVVKTYNIDKNEITDSYFVANPMLHFFNKLKSYLNEEESSENSPLSELQSKIDDLQNKVIEVKGDIENDIKVEIREIKDKTIRSKWVEYSGHVSRILRTVPQVMMKPSSEIDTIKIDKLEFFEMVKSASENYGDYNEYELLYHSKGLLKVVNNKTGKYFKYPIQNNPYLMWFTPGLDRSMYVFENCSPEFVKIRLAKIVKEPAKTDMKTFTKIYNELNDLVKQIKDENIFIGKYNVSEFLTFFNFKTFSVEDFCRKMKEIDQENVTFGKVKSNIKRLHDLCSQIENLLKEKEEINSRSKVIDENLHSLQNIEIPKLQIPKTFDNLHFNVQTKFIPKVIIDQEKILPNFNFIYISCQNVNKTAKNIILQIKIIGDFQFLNLNITCQNSTDQNMINSTINDDLILFSVNLDQINTETKIINGVFTIAEIEIPFVINLKLIVNGQNDDIDYVFQKFSMPQMKLENINLPVFDGSDMSNSCQSMSDCLNYCNQFLSLVFMMKVKNINLTSNASKLYKLLSDLNEWISSRKISIFAPYGETAKSFLESFEKLRSSLGFSEKSVEDYQFSLEKVIQFVGDDSQEIKEEKPTNLEQIKEKQKQEEKVENKEETVPFEFHPEPAKEEIKHVENKEEKKEEHRQIQPKKKQKKQNQFQIPPQFQDYKPQQQTLQIPPQINQQQTLQIPPQINQQQTLQIPPQINQQQTLQIPPQINQQQTLQIPQINQQQTLQIPQINQQQTLQIPQINQQQTLQIPPQINQQQTLQIPQINQQQTLQIPPQINQQQTLQIPQINQQQTLQNTTQKQTLQMPPQLSQQTTPQILQMPPQLTQQITPQLTQQITPQLTQQITPQQTFMMPQFQQMNPGFAQIYPQKTQQFGFGQQQETFGFGQQQFGFGQQQTQFGFTPQFEQTQFGFGMQYNGFGTAPQMQQVNAGQNQPQFGFTQNNEPELEHEQIQYNRQRKRRRY